MARVGDDEFERWCEYYSRTEAYDRRRPGAWSVHEPDCWLPDARYRSACAANARVVHRELQLPGGMRPERALALLLTHDERERIVAEWRACGGSGVGK